MDKRFKIEVEVFHGSYFTQRARFVPDPHHYDKPVGWVIGGYWGGNITGHFGRSCLNPSLIY